MQRNPHITTGAHVLTIRGDVDIATAPLFRAQLESAVDASSTVIVDVSDVPFMDCAGLHPLLEARARLGDRLQLRGLQPAVWRLLLLTGLATSFGFPDDVQSRPALLPEQRST